MAADFRTTAAKYGLSEEAIDDLETAATPDSFRKQLGELGAAAKERDELKAWKESIEKAPRRVQAFLARGVDVNTLTKAEKKAIEGFTWEGDEPTPEAVAEFISEWDLPVTDQAPPQTDEQSPARRIVDAANRLGEGAPPKPTSDKAFHDALDKVPDGDDEGTKAVLAQFGRLPASEG